MTTSPTKTYVLILTAAEIAITKQAIAKEQQERFAANMTNRSKKGKLLQSIQAKLNDLLCFSCESAARNTRN